jgi:hypothetical protein
MSQFFRLVIAPLIARGVIRYVGGAANMLPA